MRIAAVIVGLLLASPIHAGEPLNAAVSVCFTPGGNCADQIAAVIDGARSSVLVQAYGFTSTPILKALVDAKKRGVKVEVILDESNIHRNSYTGATFVTNGGIPVWIDYKPAIAHNKIIIIDGIVTIGGSYNYTKSAQDRNAENVTFIKSQEVSQEFTDNWLDRKNKSKPLSDAVKQSN